MTWQWRPTSSAHTKLPGYSLTELMVVITIIVFLSTLSVPNLVGGNARFLLNNEANRIKQMITEAKVRSLAPTKNDGQGAQVYQVTFGAFPANSTSTTALTAKGTSTTNTLVLQRGVANCSNQTIQGGFTQIRTHKLARGIHIASFYPTNQAANDPTAAIRFSVGEVGFNCGKNTDPSINSANFADPNWQGAAGAVGTQARYLVIEVSSSRVEQSVFIVVDRLNSEVEISRSNPQSYFNPIADSVSPKWRSPISSSISVSCGAERSTISLTFSRADDRYSDNGTPANDNDDPVDPNRLVFYDIYWKQGDSEATDKYQALTSKYFYDLGQSQVVYTFQTDSISLIKQPQKFGFRIWAFDDYNNYTDTATEALGLEGWFQRLVGIGRALALVQDLNYNDYTFQDPVFDKGADWDCANHSATSPNPGSDSDGNPSPDDSLELQNNPGSSDTSNPGQNLQRPPHINPETPPS